MQFFTYRAHLHKKNPENFHAKCLLTSSSSYLFLVSVDDGDNDNTKKQNIYPRMKLITSKHIDCLLTKKNKTTQPGFEPRIFRPLLVGFEKARSPVSNLAF